MAETTDDPCTRIAPAEAWLAGISARRSGGSCLVPAELERRPRLVREWQEGWEDGVLLSLQLQAGCGS